MLKKAKREYKYGSGVHLILALTIRFIDGDLTLRNILLLSKETNDKLSNLVYKQALIYS